MVAGLILAWIKFHERAGWNAFTKFAINPKVEEVQKLQRVALFPKVIFKITNKYCGKKLLHK